MVESFQLGIGEKPFNLFNKYFAVLPIAPLLWFLFGSVSIAGMRPVGEVRIPFSVKIDSVFAGEKESKFNGGLLMFNQNSGIQNIVPVGAGIISESLQGFDEGALKFQGSFFESLISTAAFAEEMGKPSSDKRACNTKDKANDKATEIHFLPLFDGWAE